MQEVLSAVSSRLPIVRSAAVPTLHHAGDNCREIAVRRGNQGYVCGTGPAHPFHCNAHAAHGGARSFVRVMVSDKLRRGRTYLCGLKEGHLDGTDSGVGARQSA